MRTYRNFIGGEWVTHSSGTTLQTLNPADTREVVAEYALAERPDAAAAVASARAAFPAWAELTPVARGRILSKASQVLETRRSELAELLTREEGKTLAESTAEVQRTVDIFRFFGGLSYTLGGQTIPHDLPRQLLYTTRQPLGVVGLITPWNFPFAIPAWKLAPALVAGNAVVLKPSSLAPALALELARALAEAGLPNGVLNVVVGQGATVGEELTDNPAVAAVSFTGSHAVGHGMYQRLALRLARVQLEMGGKNPTLVLADADLNLAVGLVLRAAFGLTGQACTATSRVIVERPVLEAFTTKLVERTRALRVGNGLHPGVAMGPAVSQAQLVSDLDAVDVAQAEGARLLCGGQRLTEGDFARGHFLQPAVLADVNPSMRIAREEVFGPVLAVIPAGDFEEAISLANGVDTGLAASVVTRDLKKAMLFAEKIEVGVVKINQISTGLALQAPFGGVKQSSTDTFREQGAQAVDFYSRLRTVYLDYSV